MFMCQNAQLFETMTLQEIQIMNKKEFFNGRDAIFSTNSRIPINSLKMNK